jgi:hypothetical protein
MKQVLPEIAINVFAQMMDRPPTKDEQLTLRRLHDAYAGKDTPVAWWDTVHKYRLECLINGSFDWLQERMSADLKALRAKDATLASISDLQKVVEDAAFYAFIASGMCLVVGILLGALAYALLAR